MKGNITITELETGLQGTLSNSIRYKSKKGEISLLTPCKTTMGKFEIYCISGDFFNDIERYETKEDAERMIYSFLE